MLSLKCPECSCRLFNIRIGAITALLLSMLQWKGVRGCEMFDSCLRFGQEITPSSFSSSSHTLFSSPPPPSCLGSTLLLTLIASPLPLQRANSCYRGPATHRATFLNNILAPCRKPASMAVITSAWASSTKTHPLALDPTVAGTCPHSRTYHRTGLTSHPPMRGTFLEMASTSRSPCRRPLTMPSATTQSILLRRAAYRYQRPGQQDGAPAGTPHSIPANLPPVWAGSDPFRPPLPPRHLPRPPGTPGCTHPRSWSPCSRPCCMKSRKTSPEWQRRTPGSSHPPSNQQTRLTQACSRETRRGESRPTRPALKTPHLRVLGRSVRKTATAIQTTTAITPTEGLPFHHKLFLMPSHSALSLSGLPGLHDGLKQTEPQNISPQSEKHPHRKVSPHKSQMITGGTLKDSSKVNKSGCDWDSGLQSHKHQTDIQRCDWSLWNIWRFKRGKKPKHLHICLLTDACRNCLFFLHQTHSGCGAMSRLCLPSHLQPFTHFFTMCSHSFLLVILCRNWLAKKKHRKTHVLSNLWLIINDAAPTCGSRGEVQAVSVKVNVRAGFRTA